jgi:hypothetical protein
MCLSDGHYFRKINSFVYNGVKCREMAADMDPVYFFAGSSVWCLDEFLVPSSTGRGIVFQRSEPPAYYRPGFVITIVYESIAPAPDDNRKTHYPVSLSGIKSSSFMIRWVSSYNLRRFSSRTRFLMTSSKV